MIKIIKEPLVHFLLIGAFLFLLFQLVNNSENDREIIIDQYDINELAAKWELQWGKQPTDTELSGLVESHLREEIFYREGMAMNIDHNDEIIRRRIARKMEFLSEGLAEATKPTNEVLQDYYENNKENYRTSDLISFQHIFFSRESRSGSESDAEKCLQKKNFNSEQGDPFPFPLEFTNANNAAISKIFGSEFANSLSSSTKLGWQGPVKSGFGSHVVNIIEHKIGSVPEMEDIYNKVLNDYTYELQNQLNNELYLEFKKKYNIVYDLD
jgi:hypothetical protein